MGILRSPCSFLIAEWYAATSRVLLRPMAMMCPVCALDCRASSFSYLSLNCCLWRSFLALPKYKQVWLWSFGLTKTFLFRLLHLWLFRAKRVTLTFSVAKLVQAVFCKYQVPYSLNFFKNFLPSAGHPIKTFPGPGWNNWVNPCIPILPLPTLKATLRSFLCFIK